MTVVGFVSQGKQQRSRVPEAGVSMNISVRTIHSAAADAAAATCLRAAV
jgi:ketol-acid reductoisomerase